jgi:hypothetical protein
VLGNQVRRRGQHRDGSKSDTQPSRDAEAQDERPTPGFPRTAQERKRQESRSDLT